MGPKGCGMIPCVCGAPFDGFCFLRCSGSQFGGLLILNGVEDVGLFLRHVLGQCSSFSMSGVQRGLPQFASCMIISRARRLFYSTMQCISQIPVVQSNGICMDPQRYHESNASRRLSDCTIVCASVHDFVPAWWRQIVGVLGVVVRRLCSS